MCSCKTATLNDRLGHDVGDMYIKGFASVANNTFKKYGDIYRIGGDEFSILTYMKLEDIQEKLENMTSLFEKEYKEEEFGVKASFAYGYANSKEDNVSNIEALVKIADERMYELKSEQKKRMKGKANI